MRGPGRRPRRGACSFAMAAQRCRRPAEQGAGRASLRALLATDVTVAVCMVARDARCCRTASCSRRAWSVAPAALPPALAAELHSFGRHPPTPEDLHHCDDPARPCGLEAVACGIGTEN